MTETSIQWLDEKNLVRVPHNVRVQAVKLTASTMQSSAVSNTASHGHIVYVFP
jgi:hypothetical protein